MFAKRALYAMRCAGISPLKWRLFNSAKRSCSSATSGSTNGIIRRPCNLTPREHASGARFAAAHLPSDTCDLRRPISRRHGILSSDRPGEHGNGPGSVEPADARRPGSRRRQRAAGSLDAMTTVGFQGEPGAFSEEAALALLGEVQPEGFVNFDALVEAVDAG